MQTKLTLRLDDKLIRRAKAYARESGKSVSELVAGIFSTLSTPEPAPQRDLTPVVKRLAGALTGKSVNKADYRKHLQEKYR